MTINLAPSRPSPLLSHIRPGARKRGCRRTVFLIANPRLKPDATHRESNLLKIPNRERMAISLRFTKPPTTAKHQFQRPTTHSLSANQPPGRRLTRLEFLIVTPRLGFPLKPANTTPSKFLIVTKRTFIIRPAAWNSPPSLRSLNFNFRRRDELRLKWHRHSCLCSDDHQPTTSTHHPRPHFTSASTQPKSRLQSNLRELRCPNFNLRRRDELRLKWHRHSCLCSDDHQPTTSTHHPRPHFTSASTQPDPRLQSNSRKQAEAA
jgi:hypothetical protein